MLPGWEIPVGVVSAVVVFSLGWLFGKSQSRRGFRSRLVRHVAEIADVAPDTFHGYLSRGQWPAADTDDHLWRGTTVHRALAARRRYHRSEQQPDDGS